MLLRLMLSKYLMETVRIPTLIGLEKNKIVRQSQNNVNVILALLALLAMFSSFVIPLKDA